MGLAINSRDTNNIRSEAISEVNTTRSDIASIKRSIQDINEQIDKKRSSIDTVLRNSRTLDSAETLKLLKEREKLNHLNQTSEELQRKLLPDRPVSSAASLSTQERREIKGLYNSGLYTQRQLAEQYGVTQSAVSQSIRSNDD